MSDGMERRRKHPTRRHVILGGCAVAVAGLGIGANSAWSANRKPVLVAAAANLRPVMPALLAAMGEAGVGPVRISFGASGNLARQIAQGAPFEVFMSADRARVSFVAEHRRIEAQAVYARGRLAWVSAAGLGADRETADLAALVAATGDGRVAIGNPEHAPYGMAARAALQSANVWSAIEPRLVFAENVAQAAQFALTGNAAAAITSLSLAQTPELRARLASVTIAEALYPPIEQEIALLAAASDAARAVYAFMVSAAGARIFAEAGYAVPSPAKPTKPSKS